MPPVRVIELGDETGELTLGGMDGGGELDDPCSHLGPLRFGIEHVLRGRDRFGRRMRQAVHEPFDPGITEPATRHLVRW
ncbi:MAG: hypothetical protein ACHQDC_01075 [Acidimicrobiales bacterium]